LHGILKNCNDYRGFVGILCCESNIWVLLTIKVSVDIFMISPYKTKTVFMIAVFINLFFLLVFASVGYLDGLYDPKVGLVIRDYAKYLEIILGTFHVYIGNHAVDFVNENLILGITIFINFFITLATIPSVVKFGNWYSSTLK
jgi:hypothetical protein